MARYTSGPNQLDLNDLQYQSYTQAGDGKAALVVSNSDGSSIGSSTQYAEGNTTAPAQGTAILGRYTASPSGVSTDGGLYAPLMDNFHQLKVVPVGTISASNVAASTGGYSFSHLAANGTTTIKSGAGTLHTVSINNTGTTDTVTIYDNTAGSGSVIAVIGSSVETTLKYDLAFSTGLTVVIAGTTAPDVTFTYK